MSEKTGADYPDWENRLVEHPALVLELLAKCVNKLGGSVVLTTADHPAGPFNLLAIRSDTDLTLRLSDNVCEPPDAVQ
jgi:hypothetical protein